MKESIANVVPPALAPSPEAGPWVQGPRGERPGREHEALWFALAKRRLTSVVLVPADGAVSLERVGALANSLADVGRRMGDLQVTGLVAMDPADPGHISRVAAVLASTREEMGPSWPGSSPLSIIVAVQSVVKEPLGLALVQAADGVVLCVEMGQTLVGAARETIELVGASLVVGCVTV